MSGAVTSDVSGHFAVCGCGWRSGNYPPGQLLLAERDAMSHRCKSVPVAGFTDDELREEVKRRCIKGLDVKIQDVAVVLSDDELRAECERRGFAPWFSAAVDDLRKQLQTEKDDHDAHEAKLARDRDEWKRRAEAAEAKLTDPRQCIRIETGGELVPVGSIHNCGRIELLVTRVDGDRLPGFHSERGPGIAKLDTRPDNSVAWLDEDLLADDAP